MLIKNSGETKTRGDRGDFNVSCKLWFCSLVQNKTKTSLAAPWKSLAYYYNKQ